MKTRKPLSTKKPPVPVADHAVLDKWIRQSMPGIQPLLIQVDEIIRSHIPGLHFAVKWSNAFYGTPELEKNANGREYTQMVSNVEVLIRAISSTFGFAFLRVNSRLNT